MYDQVGGQGNQGPRDNESTEGSPQTAAARVHELVSMSSPTKLFFCKANNLLLVTKGIATRSQKLLVAPGSTTRNRKLLVTSAHRVPSLALPFGHLESRPLRKFTALI